MNMKTPFTIEELNHYLDVERLYRVIYPGKICSKFDWLYAQNPAGNAQVFVTRDNATGEVVAALVIMPMRVWFFDREIRVGQAIDGMVHPEYRNRHLFNSLFKEVFQQIQKRYEFLLGFPNQAALGSELRAGWKRIGSFFTYSLPLKPTAARLCQHRFLGAPASLVLSPLLTLYHKFHLSRVDVSGAELQLSDLTDLNADALFAKLKQRHPIATIRDSDFISWRFRKVPESNYVTLQYSLDGQPRGYFVVKGNKGSAEIIDLSIGQDLIDQQRSLKLLIEFCHAAGYRAIHFIVSESSYCCPALKKMGFIRRKADSSIIMWPISEAVSRINIEDCFITIADTDWI